MDQYLDTAYDVTTQLFGEDSQIPWWSWVLVVVALIWKALLPERRTAADRDEALAKALLEGTDGDSGKGKKGKKKKK